MKKLLLAILFIASAAQASDRITAIVIVTNATQNGYTFTVNGNTRTWTNQVYNANTQILTNSDVTGCGSKTNLFEQIALNQFSGPISLIPNDTGSNSFQLAASCGAALTVSASAGYASVTYSTQTCTTAISIVSPFSAYPSPATRTNVSSQLVSDLNTYGSNSISQGAPIAGQLLGTSNTQTVYGQKTFNNPSGIWNGSVIQSADSGNVMRGSYESNSIIDHSIATNLVNYGNAFSSPGAGSLSEQFGNGSVANAFKSTTVAGSATTNFASSFGHEAIASGWASTSVGADSTASGSNSFAGGAFALASGNYSAVLGGFGQATFDYSIAIGPNSATTATNQVMLGSPGISTVVQNNLNVQTNETVGGSLVVSGGENVLGLRTNAAFTGTNNFPAGADVAFGRYSISTLANGNNSAVAVGTNCFVELSGPTGGFATAGFANGRDGKLIVVLNQTGQAWTNLNESGIEPTPANRIRTLTGADLVLTNAIVTLIYSGAASRWIVQSHNP